MGTALRDQECCHSDSRSDVCLSDDENCANRYSQQRLTGERALFRAKDALITDCVLLDTARSGIWYTHHISIRNSVIAAPKTFRRADGIHLENVSMPNAEESLWTCSNITMNNIDARGDYFAKDARDITVRGLKLTGNYAFDGGRNIEVSDSMLISKDAFCNCENVVVRD